VVVCALAVAGLGGTLAGWSDTEESYDNYISTGSLDLKVEGKDDRPWGTGINQTVSLVDIVPCNYHKVDVTVENHGQAIDEFSNNMSAPFSVRFKDPVCSNVDPTCGTGIEWPAGSGLMKPEPELVAEYGGVLAQVNIIGTGVVANGNWGPASFGYNTDFDTIPAVNATGRKHDTACSLRSVIDCTIWFGPSAGSQSIVWGPLPLTDLFADEIYIGELPQCGEDYLVSFEFHAFNIDDDDWPGREQFSDWQTNAYMKDRIDFNIEFILGDYNAIRPG
jgi:predicted ribosomally synthesized peptide with SipW-like signal peptide